ncbi:MAG: alanine racemase [Alphaproteobacteria bacterium]|nr:alanine racemase [Alphaproteobacteria bacterium]
MKLADLPTPCLVLDRGILQRNLDTMSRVIARHGVALRPHLKTAKSIDVARLALTTSLAKATGITVSTLAEAEYFLAHGITDLLLAVGITPQKLERVAELNGTSGGITIITDDLDTAAAIAAHPIGARTLIEIDCGEARGGISPDSPALLEIAAHLGTRFAGIMTHAGHSYSGRSAADMATIAETERRGAITAAERLRTAGHACPIVSMGSSPTALYAGSLEGITEVRAGVYMLGDLFQAEIGTHGHADIAVTVLTSVIGRRPAERRIVVDAGGIALSKDRSTETAPHDWGFGHARDIMGEPTLGHALVKRANQEHGIIDLDPTLPDPGFRIGDKLRIAPNHVCMTSAAHDRYFVVDGSDEVIAVWRRVNGW